MFFATRPLEQATDEVVAAYKAGRFPPGRLMVDFCCGIGGDLLALASRGPVLGVDRDPVLALLAGANLAHASDGVGDRQSAVVAQEAAPQLFAGAAPGTSTRTAVPTAAARPGQNSMNRDRS